MTTHQPPRWSNPEFMPSDELLARLDAAIQQFASITRAVDDFVATHQPTIVEYYVYTAANALPDGVWQPIDACTGYAGLHDDMHELSDRLDDLANGKLAGIGLDNDEVPSSGF